MVKWKILMVIFVSITVISAIFGVMRPLPDGISVSNTATAANVDFIYDLTYQKDGKTIREQRIFNKVSEIINNAEEFVILDMFLFNDEYNRKDRYPELASRLTETLISRKKANPELKVTVITDEINTFYGAYPSKFAQRLRENHINVVFTDLTKIRDSNPVYSGFWRAYLQWFGAAGSGWISNAFSPDSPEVNLRAYLKLFNFKANHRKVLITERQALVTSANPHDASGYHSNIAFVVDGEILKDIARSEQAVAVLSGHKNTPLFHENAILRKTGVQDGLRVTLVTEGKIRKHMLESIQKASKGDSIWIGMFYLSDRGLINKLLDASKRGVKIRLVLDPNKDAFGREKNGIPNRPVAAELVERSGGAIEVRWYDTRGEQFHTKMVMIKGKDRTEIFGGSANLTRRNIGDYNLETDLKITAPNDSKLVNEVSGYFNRIWNNKDGHYTVDFQEYEETSLSKKSIYRFQEWSGISSF